MEPTIAGEPAGQEALLTEGGREHYHVAVASEGSRLIGGTLSAQITRHEAGQVLVEGFFPACKPGDLPRRSARVALQELGLPYAQDPAVTRHLAAFLAAHAPAGFAALGQAERAGSAAGGALPRPDAILLNGGVFNAQNLAERLVQAVSAWWPESPPIRLLAHDSLELAVARGAAYYGLARHGLGRRIGGGAAHAFYIGLEKRGRDEAPLALCVIPRGHEEGETVDLGGRVFRLTLGRPVQFPLFTTTSDRVEKSGEVVPQSEDLRALPPIHALLQSAGGKTGEVPVHLRATLTEIGTLELWCVSNASPEQWRLEFELRGSGSADTHGGGGIDAAPVCRSRGLGQCHFRRQVRRRPARSGRCANGRTAQRCQATLDEPGKKPGRAGGLAGAGAAGIMERAAGRSVPAASLRRSRAGVFPVAGVHAAARLWVSAG